MKCDEIFLDVIAKLQTYPGFVIVYLVTFTYHNFADRIVKRRIQFVNTFFLFYKIFNCVLALEADLIIDLQKLRL